MNGLATPRRRKVSLPLGFGIIFLPVIFAWFTLRKGHSTKARVLGLGWMVLFSVFAASPRKSSMPDTAKQIEPVDNKQAKPAIRSADEDRQSQFDRSFVLEVRAEKAVKDLLRDPNSAEFGKHLYDVSTGTVCGEVNAKNGFGGYTGRKLFIYQNGEVRYPEDMEPEAGEIAISACAGARGREQLSRD
ncbi:MAG TPA: hypothetical protein VF592_03655 [Sphingomonas sp.]|jgi:hypothetical protein|uniref:hypothetical protein n=1 Tax=Sphingomonas sp. TaxID=28214 RepID=UPI002EDAB7F2